MAQVAHLTAHAKEGRDAKVTCLSKRDRRIVRSLEPSRLLRHETCVYKMYGCLRCRVGPPMTLVQVLNHCKDECVYFFPLLAEAALTAYRTACSGMVIISHAQALRRVAR